MMRITLISLTLLCLAATVVAAPADLFSAYEQTRQALVRQSLTDVQDAAKQLAGAARGERQKEIARRADALAAASDLPTARRAFGAVSDIAVQYRNSLVGMRPYVAYCSMERKSWLQPTRKISNPYVGADMASCGQLVDHPDTHNGHH